MPGNHEEQSETLRNLKVSTKEPYSLGTPGNPEKTQEIINCNKEP